VRPKLNVLVPFDLFAAVRPFVIQFAVMEAHGTTQDRLSERCGWALKGEFPKGVVMIYGWCQAAQPWSLSRMVGLKV
jgi:hypothetical protein